MSGLSADFSRPHEMTAELEQVRYLVFQGMAGKGPRINLTTYHWEIYDNDTQAWVDTGVNAHGQDAYSPYISDSGYWYVWDDQGQEYVNTNVKAQGPQGDPGYSPEVTVESIQGGHTVTITDEEHPQGQSFNVMNGFGGISEDVKVALLNCFEHVAWVGADGQDYYDALEAALYPPKTLVSISAAFNQGSAVIYDTDSLDSLKQYLTVTAHYDDTSTGVVTNYTLSGTLTVGTSTITVLYSGKTTTFTVNVTAPATLASISAVFTQGDAVIYNTDSLDTLKQYLVVTATMTDSTTQTVTDYTLSGTLTVGTSNITVLYNGKSDTFTVTVTADDTLYRASNVVCNNDNYQDTGIKLLENDIDFTIAMDADFNGQIESGSNQWALLFCIGVVGNTYPGVCLQQKSAGSQLAIIQWGTAQYTFDFKPWFIGRFRVVLTHASGSGTMQYYYRFGSDDAVVTGSVSKAFQSVGATLKVGGHSNGKFKGTINNCKVYSKVLSSSEIDAFMA